MPPSTMGCFSAVYGKRLIKHLAMQQSMFTPSKQWAPLVTPMVLWQLHTGLPDENFNKKPNSAKKRSEKGQTDGLKARKKSNFICGIAILLSQRNL